MRLFSLLLLTTLLGDAESHPSWWNFASPEATALVGIHWENLRQSPFVDAVSAELSSTGSLGFPDLPCLSDAKQFLISSPELLAIAAGMFPAETVRSQAPLKGLKQANYHGVPLWISPGKTTLSVAVISDQILLLGLRKTLEAAIDRNLLETGRQYSPLLARAGRFSQTQDLWIVATQLPDPLASLFVPIDIEARGFEGGISVRDGLQLDATLNAASDDAAKSAAENLKQSIATLPGVARGLQVTVASRNVLLALQVSRNELTASLRQAPAPAPAVPEPPKPAGPQIIRIFGLDEGPREIVLPPPRPVQR